MNPPGSAAEVVERTERARQEIARVQSFNSLLLSRPLDVVIEDDEGGFLARAVDIPMLYGSGDSILEAVEMLKSEVESLYQDLEEDKDWPEDYRRFKALIDSLLVRTR